MEHFLFLSATAPRITTMVTTHCSCCLATTKQQLIYVHVKKKSEIFLFFILILRFKATLCNSDCDPLLWKMKLNNSRLYVAQNSNFSEDAVAKLWHSYSLGFRGVIMNKLINLLIFHSTWWAQATVPLVVSSRINKLSHHGFFFCVHIFSLLFLSLLMCEKVFSKQACNLYLKKK